MKLNLSLLILGSLSDALGIDQKEASNFLSRERRSNSNKYFGVEEIVEGKLRPECYEEDCTDSEALEAIENIRVATVFKQHRQSPCTKFDLCNTIGTQSCLDSTNTESNTKLKNEDFRCLCKEGFSGDLCNIACNDDSTPKPLTTLLTPESYSASSTFNDQFK